MAQDAASAATVATLYGRLEQEATDTLRRDGIEPTRIRLQRQADVRYLGQSMEVRVDAPGGAIDAAFLDRLAAAFHAAHRRTFGYDYAGQQKVEYVNFCVSGFGLIERPRLPKLAADCGAAAPRGQRTVYFDGAFRDTPIYQRGALGPGARIAGPAIVEEFGSTTVVFPDQHLDVDPHGITIIRSNKPAQQTRPTP